MLTLDVTLHGESHLRSEILYLGSEPGLSFFDVQPARQMPATAIAKMIPGIFRMLNPLSCFSLFR